MLFSGYRAGILYVLRTASFRYNIIILYTISLYEFGLVNVKRPNELYYHDRCLYGHCTLFTERTDENWFPRATPCRRGTGFDTTVTRRDAHAQSRRVLSPNRVYKLRNYSIDLRKSTRHDNR